MDTQELTTISERIQELAGEVVAAKAEYTTAQLYRSIISNKLEADYRQQEGVKTEAAAARLAKCDPKYQEACDNEVAAGVALGEAETDLEFWNRKYEIAKKDGVGMSKFRDGYEDVETPISDYSVVWEVVRKEPGEVQGNIGPFHVEYIAGCTIVRDTRIPSSTSVKGAPTWCIDTAAEAVYRSPGSGYGYVDRDFVASPFEGTAYEHYVINYLMPHAMDELVREKYWVKPFVT